MAKIKFSDKSKLDLKGIKKFISEDNPERAESFIKEVIDNFINTVGSFPLSCPRYSKRKNIRRFIYGQYNIYYKYDKKKDLVDVAYIYHSAQLFNSIFFD